MELIMPLSWEPPRLPDAEALLSEISSVEPVLIRLTSGASLPSASRNSLRPRASALTDVTFCSSPRAALWNHSDRRCPSGISRSSFSATTRALRTPAGEVNAESKKKTTVRAGPGAAGGGCPAAPPARRCRGAVQGIDGHRLAPDAQLDLVLPEVVDRLPRGVDRAERHDPDVDLDRLAAGRPRRRRLLGACRRAERERPGGEGRQLKHAAHEAMGHVILLVFFAA